MSRFLEEFAQKIREKNVNLYTIAEIRTNGIAESITLQKANRCQDSYSVAKAFAVAGVGLLYDRGLIRTEERIPDILGELCPPNMDPHWNDITLHMVMRHFCGLPGGFLDIDVHNANQFGSDYLSYMLSYPIDRDPAAASIYTDGAYYLVGRIVEKRAGMPLDSFLWKELFFPMEFLEMAWSRCPLGHPMGATGLYIRTEDMVKLGGLFLNRGMWKGQRLLSEEWIQTVLDRQYEFHPLGHGGSYGKGGMCGQMLMVIPEHNRAVAWHGFCGGVDAETTAWIASYGDIL